MYIYINISIFLSIYSKEVSDAFVYCLCSKFFKNLTKNWLDNNKPISIMANLSVIGSKPVISFTRFLCVCTSVVTFTSFKL